MASASRRPDSNEHLILIVCPHRFIREGLGYLFSQEEDLLLAGMVADASEAQASVAGLQPDVVLIVDPIGHLNGTDMVGQFKTTAPNLPVLLVSANTRLEDVQAALSAGAKGYLPLDISQDELIRAVYTVCRGEFVLHPTLMLELLSQKVDQPAVAAKINLGHFSHREQEVLACLARGLSDRDIAQQLFISVRTVQSHLEHIYGKLGVHSRVEAALTASWAGWFSPP